MTASVMKLSTTFPALLALCLAACEGTPRMRMTEHFSMHPAAANAPGSERKRYFDACVDRLSREWQTQTDRAGFDAGEAQLAQQPMLAAFTLLADGRVEDLEFRSSIPPSARIVECTRLTFAHVRLPPMPPRLAAETGGRMACGFWLAQQVR